MDSVRVSMSLFCVFVQAWFCPLGESRKGLSEACLSSLQGTMFGYFFTQMHQAQDRLRDFAFLILEVRPYSFVGFTYTLWQNLKMVVFFVDRSLGPVCMTVLGQS